MSAGPLCPAGAGHSSRSRPNGVERWHRTRRAPVRRPLLGTHTVLGVASTAPPTAAGPSRAHYPQQTVALSRAAAGDRPGPSQPATKLAEQCRLAATALRSAIIESGSAGANLASTRSSFTRNFPILTSRIRRRRTKKISPATKGQASASTIRMTKVSSSTALAAYHGPTGLCRHREPR